MLRFSANLGFLWPGLDTLARIDAAAAVGFKAVELHWPYATPAAEVRDRCASHGISLLGINTPLGDRKGDFGLGALPDREAEFRTSFDQALEYADKAGASAIHIMAGLTQDLPKDRCGEVLMANLSYAASATERTLLLEPINQRDKPGYFYSTSAEAIKFITDLGAPNLKLMFDVYHLSVSEGDITKRLERYKPRIGHIQIAAVPSRAEPDEGEINYPYIFEAIERLGYDGWIGCEYIPRGDTDAGLSWVHRLTGGPLSS